MFRNNSGYNTHYRHGDTCYGGKNAETEKYTELQSPSIVYNMNVDWKYKRAENGADFPLKVASDAIKDGSGKNFYAVDYDDSDWETVSVPHAVNAEDSFDGVGVDAGEAGLYRGFMFYRKKHRYTPNR